MRRRRFAAPVLAAALVSACGAEERASSPPDGMDAIPPACADPAARAVVERLGARMKDVPLLAPDSVAAAAVRRAYAELATPQLLAEWAAAPRGAPGRELSSPWPERIEVEEVAEEAGGCRVDGAVVLVASGAGTAGPAEVARERATFWLTRSDGWRIARWQRAEDGAAAPGTEPDSPAAAADAIRAYWADIAAGRFRDAYARWSQGGAASGQSFDAFAAGFAETASVTVDVGKPGPVEGAAGSRYVEVPVEIRSRTTAGEEQRFAGSYTLRLAVVDGATPEQRRWHIHAADVAPLP